MATDVVVASRNARRTTRILFGDEVGKRYLGERRGFATRGSTALSLGLSSIGNIIGGDQDRRSYYGLGEGDVVSTVATDGAPCTAGSESAVPQIVPRRVRWVSPGEIFGEHCSALHGQHAGAKPRIVKGSSTSATSRGSSSAACRSKQFEARRTPQFWAGSARQRLERFDQLIVEFNARTAVAA